MTGRLTERELAALELEADARAKAASGVIDRGFFQGVLAVVAELRAVGRLNGAAPVVIRMVEIPGEVE